MTARRAGRSEPARPGGLEPPTRCLEGSCSVQLSYGRSPTGPEQCTGTAARGAVPRRCTQAVLRSLGQRGSMEDMTGGQLRGARVLVVDDEPSITDAVATALGYEGFDVETAANGRAALARIEDFRPDLVVLDIMLPDLDGIAITRRLRRDGIGVPVLFLTARDDAADKIEGLT